MTKKRRVNPHRIPLRKGTYDSTSLLYEEMHQNLYYAWLLVIHTLLEQEIATQERVKEIWLAMDDGMIAYKLTTSQVYHASDLLKMSEPYPNLERAPLKTEADVVSFRKKAHKQAVFLALCSLSLALEKLGCLSEHDFHKILTNIPLTLAEIESGYMSYEKLEEEVRNHGLYLIIGDNELILKAQTRDNH